MEQNLRTTPIRIGSRGSQLALWQANHILYALRDRGYLAELEIIRTTGDRMQQPGFVPPPGLDGKGIFIKEIEEALAEGRIDLAVHSLKDLPTTLAPQFTLAAIPRRADARDVWVCEPFWALHGLPEGGRIGTTSPRRRAQLLALRPDVTFVEVRGNIDTRLKKLAQGQCDALVLAAAGLDRLNLAQSVHSRFAPGELCPAPGQGALALETRAEGYPATGGASTAREASAAGGNPAAVRSPAAGAPNPDRDHQLREALAFLDHPSTRFAVTAERHALDALGGGCQLPIGIHVACEQAGLPESHYRVYAQVVAPDGECMIQLDQHLLHPIDPLTLGARIADDLKSRGALALLNPDLQESPTPA
jgi:hydroxymethylbilane synthase